MDADHHESQQEADKFGNDRQHCDSILPQAGINRHAGRALFEHEQGQDDGKDPVAEGFEPVL
jgi:hypothetical protein